MIRSIIIDDEQHCVNALLNDLQQHCPSIEVADTCNSAKEGIMSIKKLNPDLVFLDVEMPWMNGFEMLQILGDVNFSIIFTTAHDQFAAKAFRLSAVDYLLKPVSPERLQTALDRVRERERATPPKPAPKPADVRASARRPGELLERVVIRDGTQVHVVPVDRIDYIEAQDDYVAFKTGGKLLLKEQTMADVETSLDPRRFVRIHRSYVLNVERLARVELYAKDSRVAILTDGTKLPVSRAGYQRLQQLL